MNSETANVEVFIKVRIVGDHPWTGTNGEIDLEPSGGVKVTRILGTGPDMYKVRMENGQECFAEMKHLRLVK